MERIVFALIIVFFTLRDPGAILATSLSGLNWYLHDGTANLSEADVRDAGWIPARVPGSIQSDLEAAHLLKPLWYGIGDPRLDDVARKDWWYRVDFVLPQESQGKRVRLVFDGVDFECEVWLNGQRLGNHAGQVGRFGFDVSQFLRQGELNRLAVRVKRAPEETIRDLAASSRAKSAFGTSDWFLFGYVRMRELLKSPRSATSFGWDWAPNLFNLGIWRDVRVEITGPARIDWVQIQTALSNSFQRAVLKLRLEVHSLSRLNARATFRISGHDASGHVATAVPLAVGANVIEAELTLDKPQLWWPNGHGSQPLYDLETSLEDTESGTRLDSRTTRFGVREIRWGQVEGAPEDFINPYRLIINGRTVRMMGCGMLATDVLYGRMGDRVPRLVHLAKVLGINTLRMNGAGIVLPDEFYSLADELGIMVSQEFPLANTWPEIDPVFLANLESTGRDIVRQLRNHPSIIEWGGGNEMPWQQGTDHTALDLLERVCAQEDTSRIFRATDPMQGSKHSPWDYEPRTHYNHYNSILPFAPIPQKDWVSNSMFAMRYGEFGTSGPANLELFQREIPPASQWPLKPDDPILIRKHVLQAVDNATWWMKPHTIEQLFGPMDGIETMIPAGQFLAAEGLRYAFDELRRKGKRIGGMISWDYTEPWPNGAGSYVVDYDGRPLMNFALLQQALAPVSLSLRYRSILYDPAVGVEAGLFLTSDSTGDIEGLKWNWIGRDRRGQIIGKGSGSASIKPLEVLPLAELRLRPPQETALGPVFIELHLTDAAGKRLTERVHVFGAENKHVWPLDGLLRNRVQDSDDTAPLSAELRPVRVLWIQDHHPAEYENLAWGLRRYGIRSMHVAATGQDFEKVAPNAATLVSNYDVVWLGGGDERKSGTLASRLGVNSLAVLEEAVRAGIGLGVEGGRAGYPNAGLSNTPLLELLPVSIIPRSFDMHRWSANAVAAQPAHALVSGNLMGTFPGVDGYNLLLAKPTAEAILQTSGGYSLLSTARAGKGRVLAYSSEVVGDWAESLRTWSGYPFFVARMLTWLSGGDDGRTVAIDLPTVENRLVRPVRRTTLRASPRPMRTEGNKETLEIELANQGSMTALFCEPHPMLEYRTDITVGNNYAFVPPGEARSVTISATAKPVEGLTLAETGWRISCWNADDLILPPSEEVLLSLGRRDRMAREYGESSSRQVLQLAGKRPDTSLLPWLLAGPQAGQPNAPFMQVARFAFEIPSRRARVASRLRIHTSDQSSMPGPVIQVVANGRRFAQPLKPGLGVQRSDRHHLAFSATAKFDLPAGTLRHGENVLEVSVANGGWFSWDALDLTVVSDAAQTPIQNETANLVRELRPYPPDSSPE